MVTPGFAINHIKDKLQLENIDFKGITHIPYRKMKQYIYARLLSGIFFVNIFIFLVTKDIF